MPAGTSCERDPNTLRHPRQLLAPAAALRLHRAAGHLAAASIPGPTRVNVASERGGGRFLREAVKAVEPFAVEATGFDGLLNGAAGLASMAAVAKMAVL